MIKSAYQKERRVAAKGTTISHDQFPKVHNAIKNLGDPAEHKFRTCVVRPYEAWGGKKSWMMG
jgi:hypothetical protein